MDFIIWFRHIGYTTLRSYRDSCRALAFIGYIILAIVFVCQHPQTINGKLFIEKFYSYGPKCLSLTIVIGILLSAIITLFSGLQLAVFSAAIHLSKLYDVVLPLFVTPLMVNLILLFRSLNTASSNRDIANYQQDASFILSHFIAMPGCALLLYAWFYLVSVGANLYLTSFFDVNFIRYFNELVSNLSISTFFLGATKVVVTGFILSFVVTYYQYKPQHSKSKMITSMLLLGSFTIILAQAATQLLIGFIQE